MVKVNQAKAPAPQSKSKTETKNAEAEKKPNSVFDTKNATKADGAKPTEEPKDKATEESKSNTPAGKASEASPAAESPSPTGAAELSETTQEAPTESPAECPTESPSAEGDIGSLLQQILDLLMQYLGQGGECSAPEGGAPTGGAEAAESTAPAGEAGAEGEVPAGEAGAGGGVGKLNSAEAIMAAYEKGGGRDGFGSAKEDYMGKVGLSQEEADFMVALQKEAGVVDDNGGAESEKNTKATKNLPAMKKLVESKFG